MNKQLPTNSRFLKKYNEKNILDLIRIHKSISRAELSKVTKLSATAIGIIVSKLLEKGYVIETGSGESSGGRRPVLLELKPRSYYSLGIDIDIDFISLMVLDLTGSIIDKKVVHFEMPKDFVAAMKIVDEKVFQFLNEMQLPLKYLLGIGISVPGMVDGSTGELLFIPYFRWKNVKIPNNLPSIPNIPVFIENESKASAIYEDWLGCCKGVRNFININIMTGIGAGIFTDGHLYRGAKGIAGEVGHMQVDENGPLCVCGNYGCLSACASVTHIVERMKRLIRQGSITELNKIQNIDDISIEMIIQAARNGDKASKNALFDAARYLGNAISMLVNALNPEKVVLGKSFYEYSDLVLDYIRDIVKSRKLNIKETNVDVMCSTVGKESSALGAAIIPLKLFFGRS